MSIGSVYIRKSSTQVLTKGQATAAESLPVVIASNQTTIPINGTVQGVQKVDETISVDPILVAGKDPTNDFLRNFLTDTIGTQQVVMGLSKIRVDDAGGGITYVGEAEPGSATASAVWRIKRVTDSGTPTDTNVDWADGDINFDNIWDNRAALSYS